MAETKIVVNCATGLTEEVELDEAGLAALSLLREGAQEEDAPSDWDILSAMLGSIDVGGDTGLEELLLVLQAQAEILKTRIGG